MTDHLSDRMRAAAGTPAGGGAQEAWAEGRHRRSRRRLATVTSAALVVVVLVGIGVAIAHQAGDAPDQVIAGPVTSKPVDAGCQPEPNMEATNVAPTPEAFVGGPGPRGSQPPTAIVRGKVVVGWWLEPKDLGAAGEWRFEHRIRLQVTDTVKGPARGEMLEIRDGVADRTIPATADAQRRLRGAMRILTDLLRSQPAEGLGRDPSDDAVEAAQSLVDEIHDEIGPLLDAETRKLEGEVGPPCHAFREGDELIVALGPSYRTGGTQELHSSSSFFVINDGRLDPALDAARRSVPGWGDNDLLALARHATPGELMDAFREAAADAPTYRRPEGDHATWTIGSELPPSPEATTFTAMVTRTGCGGGRTGEVLEPRIELTDNTVVVTFEVAELAGPQTCPGNDTVPVVVRLGEPIGRRTLFDGGCTTGGAESKGGACQPDGVRWRP